MVFLTVVEASNAKGLEVSVVDGKAEGDVGLSDRDLSNKTLQLNAS